MTLPELRIHELAIEQLNGREITRSYIARKFNVGQKCADESILRVQDKCRSIVLQHINLIKPTGATNARRSS